MFSLYQDSCETRPTLSCCARLERCNGIVSGFQKAVICSNIDEGEYGFASDVIRNINFIPEEK